MAQRITLANLVRRDPNPEPWAEGEKIPWDDPGFSERMLVEHLSQEHGLASRRLPLIEEHVDWLLATQLQSTDTRLLDLGCGPGLYTAALARRGVRCVGVDFSPASIAYARRTADAESLDCRYEQADVRDADLGARLGAGFNLVMMLYGEFNAFHRADASALLGRARDALAPGGRVVIEGHTAAAVERIGAGRRGEQRTWYTAGEGLFSPRPHLQLYEALWDAARRAATERYYIVDSETAEVTAHAQSMQANDEAEYDALFLEAGLKIVERFGTPTGEAYDARADLAVMIAAAAS